MSRLEELIKEKCPDGVEYKKVRDVIKSLKTGLNPRKNFVLNAPAANLYYVTGKDIKNSRINVSVKTDLKLESSGLQAEIPKRIFPAPSHI